MNDKEAEEILMVQVLELKKLSYSDYRAWVMQRTTKSLTVTGPSGREYQIEISAHWDNEVEGKVRVIASIDDGTISSFVKPISKDFLVLPDDSVL